MPLVWGPHWQDDDGDRQMRREGWVPRFEAARAFGRPEEWISHRIDTGELTCTRVRNATWVKSSNAQRAA